MVAALVLSEIIVEKIANRQSHKLPERRKAINDHVGLALFSSPHSSWLYRGNSASQVVGYVGWCEITVDGGRCLEKSSAMGFIIR